MGPRVSFMDLMPGMLMIGFTNGIVSPLINTVGMEGVAPQQMGMASGLLNIFRQLGIVIGVVGFGLMQATQYENYLNTHIHTVGMPSQMTTGIHAALIKAGPFSHNRMVKTSNRNTIRPEITKRCGARIRQRHGCSIDCSACRDINWQFGGRSVDAKRITC